MVAISKIHEGARNAAGKFSRRKLLTGLTAGAALLATGQAARAACAITPFQVDGPFYPLAIQDYDWDLTSVSGKTGRAEGEVIDRPADESRKPVNPDPANLDEGSTTAMVAKMQRRLIEAGETTRPTSTMPPAPVAAVIGALDYSHAAMMGDAPACDVCGAITVRNANCYKCLNCGNSMGCS